LSVTVPSRNSFFGDDFLLRRQNYTLDIAGGGYVANYAFDLSESSGLLIPNRRRAYLCDDNYKVLKDRLLIWIDYADIKFNLGHSKLITGAVGQLSRGCIRTRGSI
jgi:hypothetical protein